jgi:hypothetical protein
MAVVPTPPNSPDGATSVEVDPDAAPTLKVPVPMQGVGSEAFWKDQVTDAQKRRKKELPSWKANLSRYRGESPKFFGVRSRETISVNVDFYQTEQKKAQLFFQTPTVVVAPKRGMNQPPTIERASLVGEVVNYYLGPHEIDAEALVDTLLLDHLCPAGFGASVLGYEAVTTNVQMPVAAPPAAPSGPPLAGITSSGPVMPPGPLAGTPFQPQAPPPMQAVPQKLWCRFYWDRIEPEKLLIPAQFRSTDWAKAPWLGYEVDLDQDQAADQRLLPRKSLGVGPVGDTLSSPNDSEFLSECSHAYVIWYRASVYDSTVQNPEIYRRLVLMASDKMQPTVAVHEPSPFQTLDRAGRVVKGLRGNPIHLLSIRPMTGSAYAPSDCTISRAASDELSLGRTQMMLQKRRSLPQRGVDTNMVDKTVVDKMVSGEIQEIIPIKGDPNLAVKPIGMSVFQRENFEFNNITQQDIDRLWALGANQQSVVASGSKTATELSLIQQATDTRLTKERNNVLAWYAAGAEKLAALLEMFADQADLLPILGPDGWATWQQAAQDPTPMRFLFSIKPDSSMREDAAAEQTRLLNAYNMLARDPHFNRVAFLSYVCERFSLDPATFVIPQIPQAPPDPPKPTISLKAEDLQDASVIELLRQFGLIISPDTVTQTVAAATGHPLPPAQPPTPQSAPAPQAVPPGPQPRGRTRQLPHPGGAEKMAPIVQHQADRTGERSGPPPLA